MKFQTQFMPDYDGSKGMVTTLPSKTVPDQTLTIKELLLNHSRGIHSDVGQFEGQYFDDIEIPRFDDITEMRDYRINLENQLRSINNQINKEQNETLEDPQSNLNPAPSRPGDTGEEPKGNRGTNPPKEQ